MRSSSTVHPLGARERGLEGSGRVDGFLVTTDGAERLDDAPYALKS